MEMLILRLQMHISLAKKAKRSTLKNHFLI